MSGLERTLRRAGRWGLWAAVLAILAVTLIKVDVVVSVTGKMEPQGRVTSVQAKRDGRIITVHAQNGDIVSAGDRLFELDQVEISAELEAISVQINALIRERKRLSYMLCSLGTPDCAPPDLLTQEKALADAVLNRLKGEIEAHRMEQAILLNEADTAAGLESNLSLQIGIVEEQLNALQELAGRAASQRDIRQIELRVLELGRSRLTYARRIDETARMREQIDVRIEILKRQETEHWQTRRDAISAELEILRQRQKQLQQQRAGLVIEATRNGVVTGLSEEMIGRVISRAETLLTLVPQHQELVVAATIPSQDIGFVRTGQNAIVKVDAFPYQRFGSWDAAVRYV